MMQEESMGARRKLDQQIERDPNGRLEKIVARIGCAEAVLAKRGRSPSQLLMPSRALVENRLAELDGTFGGPLKVSDSTDGLD